MKGLTEEQLARLAAMEARLHQYPETSLNERSTTGLIVSELVPLGFSIVDLGLPTGVVARLAAGKRGKTVGLRADIDAICQNECADRPDKSRVQNVMHACGHDVHTSALLGAAMLLTENLDRLSGDVVLIFQPAEEILEGSRLLIEHGLFTKAPMDLLFGLHNLPSLPVGTVGVKGGPLMSGKDDFVLTVHGRGGHGGMPHKCVDPVVAACGIVSAMQTIVSRNVDPLDSAVVSVCSIHGGTPDNLVVDEVTLTGSVRTLTKSTRGVILERIAAIAQNGAAAYGCTAELAFSQKALTVDNSSAMTALATRAAVKAVGCENLRTPETVLASEDFSFYGEHVPSFFYFLGSGIAGRENAPWHSPSFQAAPETASVGARLYYESVLAAQAE